jgi:hypothetical protein
MADFWRDFWIRETRTGQQVAQLHDRYMMKMMIINLHKQEFYLNNVQKSLCAFPETRNHDKPLILYEQKENICSFKYSEKRVGTLRGYITEICYQGR